MKNKLILMLGFVLLVFVVMVFAVAPNQPTLNSPANNSVVYNNHPTLNITVTDDDSDYLNVSFYNGTSVFCYQETANVSTACGGLNTGNYRTENTGTIGYFYINYTKPGLTLPTSLWKVKHGGYNLSAYNLSIPFNCWNQDILQFKIYSLNLGGTGTNSSLYCFDSTNWIILASIAGGQASGNGNGAYDDAGTLMMDGDWTTDNSYDNYDKRWHVVVSSTDLSSASIYEEAMWWDMPIGNATNISNSSYATYNWTDLADGDYNWFATITDGTSTTTSPVYSFSVYDYNYTANHTTPVLETSSQTFTLNITRNSTYISNGNATLHWNGTAYPVDAVVYPTYLLFSKTFTIPAVNNQTNITLNWTYEFWNPTNTSRETNRTEDFTQTIYNIDIDDCSVYSIVALNFSLIEESNNASIAGDMDFTFSLTQEGITIAYSKSVTGVNSTAFCIPNNDVSFTAQLQSEYTANSYDDFTYFAYNLAITNTTQYIYYYLTNGTTIVTFTVTDQDSNKLQNAYIKVMKYDIGTGLYKTVEVLKTDEQGQALGNIILDTAWYKFMVEYLGVVYLDTTATKMTTTARTFRINLLSDFFDRYTDVIYNIYSTLNYTDATGNFAFTYSDPSGDYHYGCLRVVREALYGQTLINETCVASTAATILVNVNSSGSINGTYTAVGYILFSDMYVLQTLTKTWGHLSDAFGKEGLFYVFLIVLVCVCVAVFSPKVAIILAIIGLVFTNILGFYFVNAGWLVVLVIGAGLTMYRMRDD